MPTFNPDLSASRVWPILIGRGGVAVLFGLAMAIWPTRSQVILVWLSALLVIATGVVALLGVLRAKGEWTSSNVLMATLGGVAVVAGGAALIWQDAALRVVTVLLAVWLIAEGIGMIYAGWRLRHSVKGEIVLLITGLVGLGVGIYLLVTRGPGLATFMLVAGIYLAASGLALIVDALQLRSYVAGATHNAQGAPLAELTGPVVDGPSPALPDPASDPEATDSLETNDSIDAKD